MSNPIYTVTSREDDRVFIHAMQGHFVTASSHMNYYIGTSDIKHNHDVSVEASMLMVRYYRENDIEVDTVLCLYETQALGAYLAHELSRTTMFNPNPNGAIYVIGPEYDTQGNIIFRDNLKKLVEGRRVVLLISCITTGKTIERAMESVSYYGGQVVGVTSIFSAVDNIQGVNVNSIFTTDDLPGYQTYPIHDCPYCKAGEKVDAIANGYGYSLL